MKSPFRLLPLILTALAAHIALADGLVLDFDEAALAPNWQFDTQYALDQRDGQLIASSLRFRPWTSFAYAFEQPLDLSANPLVTVTMRSNPGMHLTAYLGDGAANINRTYPVYFSESLHQYTFDFSGLTGVDLTAVTHLRFAFNGATTSFRNVAQIEQIRIGDQAVKAANFSAVPNFSTYQGRSQLQIRINRIENASQLSVSGGDGLLSNLAVSAITNGTAMLSFDTVADASGTTNVTVTAQGSNAAQNTSYTFAVLVEDNVPPALQVPSEIVGTVGAAASVRLSGITDGNTTVNQPIAFTVVPENPALAADFTVQRDGDSPYALLNFNPLAVGTTNLTLTLTDNGGGDDNASYSIPLHIYSALNAAPSANPLGRQVVVANQGAQEITISGLHDGDDGTQSISITAVSADPDRIASPITVNYDGGDTATLILEPNPDNLGATTITVSLTDNGGNASNNGDATGTLSFTVETVFEALTGYVIPETAPMAIQGFDEDPTVSTWRIEGRDATTGEYAAIIPSLVEKDGAPAFRFEMVNKTTYAGVWYNLPDLNLTENPSISFDILLEPTDQASILAQVFFWDDNPIRANGERNAAGTENARMTVLPGGWRQFAVNYNDVENGLNSSAGEPINAARIQRLLFNFHPTFAWPFTSQSFTVYLRNIRVGDQAVVDAVTPDATINPVASQTVAASASPVARTVQLTNITNGAGLPANVVATSSNPALTANLAVSNVSLDGAANLTFETSGAGNATITLNVTAPGSNPTSTTFTISVVEAVTPSQTLTIDRAQRFQQFYGMGTHIPRDEYFDLYTADLKASAMRIGMIGNQSENANDNSDPFVINRAGLDYGVFDWDMLRRYHEAGVETFVLTTWSPPAWMKENLNLDFQQAQAIAWDSTANRVDPYYYDEYVEYVIASILMLKEESGITVAAIGPQNEPAFNQPYPSAILSPQRFAEFIALLGPRMAEAGLGEVKIMMPEQVFSQGFYSMAAYMQAVRANPLANQYTHVIATHGYANDGIGAGQPDFSAWTTMFNDAQSGDFPKEMWMSETFPEDSGYDSALNYAMALYGAFRYGNVSMWTSWQIEQQLLRTGRKLDSFHTFSNYSNFVRPGAVRVAITDGNDIYATAWEHDDNESLSLVLINLGNTPQVVALAAASGSTLPDSFDRYLTEANRGLEQMGTVSDSVLLPARSVTTLLGSTNANVIAPVITSALTATTRESASFSYQISADNRPTSFAATGLPTGLSINADTGLISGIPAVGTAGEVNVTISATNSVGTDSRTLVLTIEQRVNVPPVAAFSASPMLGVVPLSVQFDASSAADPDGTIVTYAWDLGDGAQASGQLTSHSFTVAGEFTVILTVTDNDGATHSTEHTILAQARPEVTFEPALLSFPAAGSGGIASATFTMSPSMQWTSAASDPWIVILPASQSGDGSATLLFRLQPNPGGHRSGSIRIFDGLLTIQQWAASPWDALPNFDGWSESAFGWLHTDSFPWIYHQHHGFCFFAAAQSETAFFLHNSLDDLGWLFIDADLYPLIYAVDRGAWLLFDESTGVATGYRWFFDFSAGEQGAWFRLPAGPN